MHWPIALANACCVSFEPDAPRLGAASFSGARHTGERHQPYTYPQHIASIEHVLPPGELVVLGGDA
jgi:hypothetical protein